MNHLFLFVTCCVQVPHKLRAMGFAFLLSTECGWPKKSRVIDFINLQSTARGCPISPGLWTLHICVAASGGEEVTRYISTKNKERFS